MKYDVARALQIACLNEGQIERLHHGESTPKQTKEEAGRPPNFLDEFCRCTSSDKHWCRRPLMPWEIQKSLFLDSILETFGVPDKPEILQGWGKKCSSELVKNKVFIMDGGESKSYDELNELHSFDWKVWHLVKKGQINFYYSSKGKDIKSQIEKLATFLLALILV